MPRTRLHDRHPQCEHRGFLALQRVILRRAVWGIAAIVGAPAKHPNPRKPVVGVIGAQWDERAGQINARDVQVWEPLVPGIRGDIILHHLCRDVGPVTAARDVDLAVQGRIRAQRIVLKTKASSFCRGHRQRRKDRPPIPPGGRVKYLDDVRRHQVAANVPGDTAHAVDQARLHGGLDVSPAHAQSDPKVGPAVAGEPVGVKGPGLGGEIGWRGVLPATERRR